MLIGEDIAVMVERKEDEGALNIRVGVETS